MILYLAGGFHFSSKIENEKELGIHLLSKYNRYSRLATFYYEKDAQIIQRSIEELDENERIIRSDSESNTSS